MTVVVRWVLDRPVRPPVSVARARPRPRNPGRSRDVGSRGPAPSPGQHGRSEGSGVPTWWRWRAIRQPWPPRRAAGGGTGGRSCGARSASASGTAARVPLRLLRGPAPAGQPPGRGQRAGPHQPRPTWPSACCSRSAPSSPTPSSPTRCSPTAGRRRFRLFRINLSTLALSHVSPGRHRPGGRPRLPPPHPVRGDRGRRRVRPRHPGHRLGRGPQRDVLVLAGGLPGDPRVPRPGQSPRRTVARRHRSWSSWPPASAWSSSAPSAGSSTC